MDVTFCTAAVPGPGRPIQQSTCIEIAPVGTPVTDDLGRLFSLKEAEFYVSVRSVREPTDRT
jgi:hypothetical protein